MTHTTTNLPAVVEHDTQDQHEAESIEPVTWVDVPGNFLRAALLCASTEETRYYLNGVFLHRVEDRVRVVSTDGHRLFLAAHEPVLAEGQEIPGWLTNGVIIHREGLAPKLSLIAKLSDHPTVKVGFGKGQPRVFIADHTDEATFRCLPVDGTYPDYQTLLASVTGGITPTMDPQRTDFKPVTFAGTYLKGVSDVAKALSGKEASVAMFASDATEAAVMTFPEAPGAMMLLMPTRGSDTMHRETASLVAPAIKGTVAALRAHLSRNQQAADGAESEVDKAHYLGKVADYEQRIADLLARTIEQPAITSEVTQEDPAADVSATDGEPIGDDSATGEPEAAACSTEPTKDPDPEAKEPQEAETVAAPEAPAEVKEAQAEEQPKASTNRRHQRKGNQRKAA